MKKLETRYLERLSDLYPTIAAASTEIINLQAIMNLPKGTEHFLTDVHGEYEAFSHVLKNGSGSVRRKIEDVFGNTLSAKDKRSLATLIYYPKAKMRLVRQTESNMEDWYRVQLYRLIEVSKRVASKYTRSKVRKALPKDFAYVIEELITEKAEVSDKESYYNEIISTIIRIGRAEEFITAISELIQRLVVDHLHIVGDIYDRGKGPHIILDTLREMLRIKRSVQATYNTKVSFVASHLAATKEQSECLLLYGFSLKAIKVFFLLTTTTCFASRKPYAGSGVSCHCSRADVNSQTATDCLQVSWRCQSIWCWGGRLW